MDTDHKQRKETSCKKSAYSKPPQKHAYNAAIPPMVPMTELQLREAEAPLELPSGQWVTKWAWLQDAPHHAGGTALVRGTQGAGLAQDALFPPRIPSLLPPRQAKRCLGRETQGSTLP